MGGCHPIMVSNVILRDGILIKCHHNRVRLRINTKMPLEKARCHPIAFFITGVLGEPIPVMATQHHRKLSPWDGVRDGARESIKDDAEPAFGVLGGRDRAWDEIAKTWLAKEVWLSIEEVHNHYGD